MDVDRSVASATARSSGNFERSEDSNGYHVASHPRSQRQGNVGKSFRSLFKRDRHLASKGWFNPEDFTAQKREWAKLSGDKDKVIGWPAHLFEQFVITGLPPTTDVKSVITDAETMRTAKSGNLDADLNLEPSDDSRHRGLKGSPLAPQVLYSYPPESPVSADLPSFCFPHGVQPTLLERTPSMSSLNDLLYSQSYLNSDANSFIFLLKVADNLPLYGVCCYMEEMLHRPPSLLKAMYPDCNMPLTRYMVAAPRCYCFLTHYPFFSVHMKVLHMILGLERLDRITMFIDEVASMPLGGGRGLSGRLDSRELPKHAVVAAAGQSTSSSAQQDREQEQRRRQRQATAVEQLRSGGAPVGPSPLGGRSSMPELHAPPPAVATRPQTRESSFPLNPHQSYDEEWGTMGGSAGGGHDSDSDVYLTPQANIAQQGANFSQTGSPDASPKQPSLGEKTATNAGFPPKSGANSQTLPQPQSQSSQRQPLLLPQRRLDLASSASAPTSTPPGPPTGPPSTPERPHPTIPGKFYSPQSQAAPQLQQRSPSSLLSRASARIRVALEASEATIKAGPADPPPRLSGLPPSSGHRRTYSQQVPNSIGNSSMHRRTSSWQDQQQQQQPQQQQQALQSQSGMVSRGSESTLGGYMTAPSEAPSGLSEASNPGATSLANVQQHLRNISAQSLSGFSDTGTPVASEPGRGLGGGAQKGPHGVHREGYESPASQQAAVGQRSRTSSWDGSGERPAGRQNSDPMAPVSPFAMVNQQPTDVPAQWQTFDQPEAFRQQQDPQQPPWGQQSPSSATGKQQPWGQSQGQVQQFQQQGQQPWVQGQMQQPGGQGQQPWGQEQVHQQSQRGQPPQQGGGWVPSQGQAGDPQGSGGIQYSQQQPAWVQRQGQVLQQPQVLAQQKPSWQSDYWSQGPGAAPQQPLSQVRPQHPWGQQQGGLLQSDSLQAQNQPPSGLQSGPVQHLVHGGEGQPLWSIHQTPPLNQGLTLQEPKQQQHGSTQLPGQSLSAQQAEAQAIAQRPWLQSQGQGTMQPPPGQDTLQQPPGRLQNAPSGVPLEHRSKTIRTMSFRQVVRSASEGDAMSLQTEPATALQVMQAYHISSVPQPGQEFEFCPDPSLQPVHYLRGRASEGLGAHYVHRAAIAAAEAEAGEGLACWTVAALCQSLSLDNILLLLTGVLLEKQLVMFCPNIGLLSTCVLSLIPLLRPFAWHSLLAPVLPDKLLSFLEAPVPFVIGVQYKTSEVRAKCSGLMRVNLYKDQIKTAGSMPPLPNDKALFASLRPAYNVLKAAGKDRARGRPMYAISEEQKRAADSLLKALQDYLTSICGELQSYAITDVQTPDRAAVLLKDAFIESFPARDRAFVRQFTETQMFSVYCDTVIK